MNPALVATFTAVAADLSTAFGRTAVHTHAGEDAEVRIVVESALIAVGDFGERMEMQTTITVQKSAGVHIGDTFTLPGDVTADDPYPDDVVWTVAQLISDDGYLQVYAVRSAT